MTGYNHPACVNPLIDEDDNSHPLKSDIDPLLPQSREHKEFSINDVPYTIDPHDGFEDISVNLLTHNQHQSATASGEHTYMSINFYQLIMIN